MRFVIDFIYLLAGLLISPRVIYRMIRRGRYRAGWSERFGRISRIDPSKKCIWIHAVSVGEVNATKTIIAELKKELPNFEIVLSTTTDTGFARANALYSDQLKVCYFPLDLSWSMKRAFSQIDPSLCLLMELEVWPNFARIAQKRGVGLAVVNGRLSDKSFPRYKLIKPLAGWMFRKLDLVLAQTDEYAQRFVELGCAREKVIVAGSLKYDTAQITDKVEGSDRLAEQLQIDRQRLWVAGGTGPGEEKIILEVFGELKKDQDFSDLRLAIVPRKPERFDSVAEMISQAGYGLLRYSQLKTAPSDQRGPADRDRVILGDTMGDLRKFYSLSSLVFIGRTLCPMGGSDMAEAAALGKCTMFGPHAFNFRQTVKDLLQANGAIEVADTAELLEQMRNCLSNGSFAESVAAAGREVIKNNQGATGRTVKAIKSLLKT